MIRPITPVQDCKKGSKAKKIATVAAGTVAAAGVALTVAAAIKGGKTVQGPNVKLLNKITAGYNELYSAAKTFAGAKGTEVAKKANSIFEATKKFVTEKGSKLKEQAQTLLESLKKKLPQKAAQTFTDGAGI